MSRGEKNPDKIKGAVHLTKVKKKNGVLVEIEKKMCGGGGVTPGSSFKA